MDRPRSPSERFYASRGESNTAQLDVPPHLIPEHDLQPFYVPPFGHFQGFSTPSSAHQNMSSQYVTYGHRIPDDGWISPRMPIPNLSLFRASPQPRVEELSDDHDDMPLPHRRSVQHRVNDNVATPGPQRGPSGPWTGQLAGCSTQISPPPEYSSTPEHTTVPAFAERPVPVMLPAREAPTEPPPPHSPAANPRTYQVPSEDEETSDASTRGRSPRTAHGALVAGNLGEVISISSDNDSSNTVYPNDSASASAPSCAAVPSLTDGGSFSSDAARRLEGRVVEVHDVCLAATQRHLEALRVNWGLRHGRDVAVPLGGGPVRRRRGRGRAGGRGSPYGRAGPPWRRAVSENGLECVRGSGLHDEDRADGDSTVDVADEEDMSQDDRIPRPTDSLLQNTSYICDLIWRRALRDREDVLGAETCGCRDMGFLFECAEAVVLYDADEWERDPERGFEVVCQAGRDLCRKLKDVKGMDGVDDIELGRI